MNERTFRRIVVGRFEFTTEVNRDVRIKYMIDTDVRLSRKKSFNLIYNSILLANTWKISVRSKFFKLYQAM